MNISGELQALTAFLMGGKLRYIRSCSHRSYLEI